MPFLLSSRCVSACSQNRLETYKTQKGLELAGEVLPRELVSPSVGAASPRADADNTLRRASVLVECGHLASRAPPLTRRSCVSCTNLFSFFGNNRARQQWCTSSADLQWHAVHAPCIGQAG